MDPLLILSAFVAGVVMFLAPCTLPLLPAYLGFISGVSYEELADHTSSTKFRRRIVRNSLMFVLGFSLVFILFGLLAGIAGSYVGPLRTVLTKIGGGIIVVFGLLTLGLISPAVLLRERRIRVPSWIQVGTSGSSLLLGGAFAFGWTPCIGPILATILLFASSTETALSGALLLFVFAIGFSIPFVVLAYAISHATTFIRRVEPYLRAISYIGGVFLVLLGIFLMVGELSWLTSWIFRLTGNLEYETYLLRFL
jgi:cytochrome c-type biogenesis protein